MTYRWLHAKLVASSALVICVAAFVGCPPELPIEPFQIVYPVTSQDWSTNQAGQLEMVVEFTHPVRLATVLPGLNVILDTNQVRNAEISVNAGPTNNKIVITSAAVYTDLLSFTPDAWFTLTVKGECWYCPPVRSTAGIRLDGDGDGVGGGNFEHVYRLIG